MAGYSGTPLVRKLGIQGGDRVAYCSAPTHFPALVEPLPEPAQNLDRLGRDLDVIVAFFTRRAALDRRIERLEAALDPDGGLWIAWPKRSSGVATDITEDVIREVALPRGLVDNKVCAIDETWSGLRLVIRRENRAAVRAARLKPRV